MARYYVYVWTWSTVSNITITNGDINTVLVGVSINDTNTMWHFGAFAVSPYALRLGSPRTRASLAPRPTVRTWPGWWTRPSSTSTETTPRRWCTCVKSPPSGGTPSTRMLSLILWVGKWTLWPVCFRVSLAVLGNAYLSDYGRMEEHLPQRRRCRYCEWKNWHYGRT